MLKRAYKIQLKKGHKLFNYFESMSLNAKNLYNTTNFYIRQVYKRITRGMYKSKHGIFINADVNGAYNILRKALPNLEDGIEVSVCTPLTLSIS